MVIVVSFKYLNPVTASSLGGDAMLVTGFDRSNWYALMGWAGVGIPLIFLLAGRLVSKLVRW